MRWEILYERRSKHVAVVHAPDRSVAIARFMGGHTATEILDVRLREYEKEDSQEDRTKAGAP